MALCWKVRTVPMGEYTEEDDHLGKWEPFGVTLEDGVALLHLKGLFDVETDPKASEIGGGLDKHW